ncbi:MAG: helix-turn-helix transcriptional regulator [Acidobacteria bacterium]|nr:helix-turn-helix transcriptional regulator [Acidobacteriota bacterium]
MKGESVSKAEVRGKAPPSVEARGKAAPAVEVEVRHYTALLRQAIRAAGLSIAEVERRLGSGPRSLRRALAGEVDLTFKHAVKVLRVIGMSQEEFFTIAFRRKGRTAVSLEGLRGEFDALVQSMQTSEAKAAGKALFSASPRRLGQAALAACRRP